MHNGTPVTALGHAETPGLFLVDGRPADSFPSVGRLFAILAGSVAIGVTAAMALALPSVALYRLLSHAI